MLEGKRVLVTGARRGIGSSIAVAMARRGADVGINDIEKDKAAEETLGRIRDEGGRASWHLADIGDRSQVTAMFDDFIDEHGGIDVLVNNAVAPIEKPFLEVTEDDFDFQIDNGLKGYFMCSQQAASAMIRQGRGGRIVSLSSVQAFRSWPDQVVYGSIKAAVSRMTLGMAWELSGHGITCNAVAPGYIDSRELATEEEAGRGDSAPYAQETKPWVPARRIGLPTDIAEVVVFLASDMAVYVNGQTIVVDGGFLTGGTPQGEGR